MRECEELLKCVQRSRDLRLDFTGGSWLQAAKLKHTCQACQKLKRRASYSLQDKSPRLAKPFAHGLNLRLNPIARLSREFKPPEHPVWQNMNFHIPSHLTIYIPLYPRFRERASRENFERETLKKTRLTHP